MQARAGSPFCGVLDAFGPPCLTANVGLRTMKRRVLIVFCLHAVVAAYCIMCGVLDSFGSFRDWLIPNRMVFFVLLGSAFAFPVVAALAIFRSGQRRPLLVEGAHIALAAGQLLFGLLPLVA